MNTLTPELDLVPRISPHGVLTSVIASGYLLDFECMLGLFHRLLESGTTRLWDVMGLYGAIGPDTNKGKRFGPNVALSAGMVPGQVCLTDPVVRIGDRCLIGRGSGIVGHLSIDIGNDVWTGHHVYITDQNHGYENVNIPISQQTQVERPVSIGDGSWLGAGVVVLPGSQIGKHVVVGANSVVTGHLPDFCVAVGSPARVIKQYSPEGYWQTK